MMADEIDVHEAFSGDVSRFDAFWAKQRQLEPTTDRSLARLAWQTALQTLPCGHPAACGDPCGWCQVLMKLRAIVCAVDCGGSYAKAIEAVRELVPEMKP